jgi:hypothetical protein
MLIPTHSDLFTSIGVMTLFPIPVDQFTAKKSRNADGTEALKITDGKQQLRVPAEIVRLDENGNAIGKEQNVVLAILGQPLALQPGLIYRLTGTIRVTPYQNDANRVAYSIVADGIAAAKAPKQD